MGSGTSAARYRRWPPPDFNPPTPWGVGRDGYKCLIWPFGFQSTHSVGSGTRRFNIWRSRSLFQSTHSVGSGTVGGTVRSTAVLNFNPPTPWGVGRRNRACRNAPYYFNPPTPWGVGRLLQEMQQPPGQISIHPLRGEWDIVHEIAEQVVFYFNPPTPWGVGQDQVAGRGSIAHFNPPTPWGVGPDYLHRMWH